MFNVSRMYNLRMLCVPDDSVTVTAETPRSRMTVSFVLGSRGVGTVWVPIGVNWPGQTLGIDAGCPLFQFARVDQSPLELFIHIAGMSKSLRYSSPPCATSTSQLLAPPPIALTWA